ncbi:DUF192 domain-containing protein [Orrella marina]|uniref:DUF192 domain-containing protein n=1 Tax=Orrella marina TaxID=2163011 RepID=A0A2R4XI44_9BURK|nr:hypothetical protein DBV39_06815 [Orrella marina]
MLSKPETISLEVAGTWRTRLAGLLGVRTMSGTQGLWIRPCNAVHTFGMRFDLSIYFLDQCDQIVRVYPRVSPGRMLVCAQACSVIELIALQSDQCLCEQLRRLKAAIQQQRKIDSPMHI